MHEYGGYGSRIYSKERHSRFDDDPLGIVQVIVDDRRVKTIIRWIIYRVDISCWELRSLSAMTRSRRGAINASPDDKAVVDSYFTHRRLTK